MTSIDEFSVQKITKDYFDRVLIENEINKIIGDYIKEFNSIFKENILNNFTIRNEEVTTFFLDNDDFILLLKNLEPIIREFFQHEELVLEFVPDPDWIGQLVLYIQTSVNNINIDDLYDKIEEIENKSSTLFSSDMKKMFLIDVE